MAGPGAALDLEDLYTFVRYSLKYCRVLYPVPAMPRETLVHSSLVQHRTASCLHFYNYDVVVGEKGSGQQPVLILKRGANQYAVSMVIIKFIAVLCK